MKFLNGFWGFESCPDEISVRIESKQTKVNNISINLTEIRGNGDET